MIVGWMIMIVTANFDIATQVGNKNVSHLTTNARLGAFPGVAHTFLISFDPNVKPRVSIRNIKSAYWTEKQNNTAEDYVVTPTATHSVLFDVKLGGVSVLPFFEWAKSGTAGAYLCQNTVGKGRVPAACRVQGNFVETTCDTNGCSFTAKVEAHVGATIHVRPTLPVTACTLNASVKFGTFATTLCVLPDTTGVEKSYITGVGGDYQTAFWVDGDTEGRLYVMPEPEDPIEQIIVVFVATILFVLWCEQTIAVSAYAVNVAALLLSPDARQVISLRAGPVAPLKSIDELFDKKSLMPLVYADASSSLAFSLTFYVYKYGTSILNRELVNNYNDQSQILVILLVAYAWFAAGTVWAVLVLGKKEEMSLVKTHVRRVSMLLLARSCFEAHALICIHLHFPPEQLGRFAELIGFFVGIVIPLITARDVYLLARLEATYVTIAATLSHLFLLVYCATNLVYPVVFTSTAVLSYQNGAIVFAATLCTQAAAGGVLIARRKLAAGSS